MQTVASITRAFDLEGALVEVFGDPPRVITKGTFRVVRLRLNGPVKLLDLRGRGGMLAGPSEAVCQTPNRAESQEWARYIYDRTATYGAVDGIFYSNSHNGMDAVALFERAEGTIIGATRHVTRLTSAKYIDEIERIAAANNMKIEP